MSVYIGIDFGTSGARACAIDDDSNVLNTARASYDSKAATQCEAWERALHDLLQSIPASIREKAQSIAFDGTSATALLVDRDTGQVLQDAKVYNASQPERSVQLVKEIAPEGHTVTSASSAFCKLMTWHLDDAWQSATQDGRSPGLLHQADWLASLLSGDRSTSDWNNALKLGFDVHTLAYPSWLQDQEWSHVLPQRVLQPGAPVATVDAAAAKRFGLSQDCLVAAGTTDSIAAFLAAGASEPGDGVTSLGSTLAIKMLSERPVDNAEYGIYSHRLGSGWLVGGASNTGGAVLRKLFTDEQLKELSQRMDPDIDTGLDYYPLVSTGERFPVNDPHLEPRLEPRPDDDVQYLQGIFESIARIEAQSYQLISDLGGTKVTRVLSAGGGSLNSVWSSIRERYVGVPVAAAVNGEASYGAARLAKSGGA